MNCHRIVFVISIVIFCLISDTALGREIVRSGARSAHVSDSFKCSENIELTVKALDRSFFSGQNTELQRLVDSTRAVLGFECSNITTIRVVGLAGGSRVYDGYSKKDQNWRLVQGTLQTPMSVAQNKRSHTVIKSRKIGFPKIRNTKSRHQKQIGPYTVMAGYSGVIPQQGIMLQANVSLPKKYWINFERMQHGLCNTIMTVAVNVHGHANYNYDRFRTNYKGKNLPPDIIDGIYLMRDLLSEQCDEFKAMRFKFYSNTYPENIRYIGTISSDSSWVIQDGIVPTSFDHLEIIRIGFKDQFSPVNPVGFGYEGTCDKNPVIHLEQVYNKEPSKPWTDDLQVEMAHYNSIGLKAAKMYKAKCPNVETISFAMDPFPEEYVCKDKEKCLLFWDKKNPSKVVPQFKYQEKPRLRDYDDVMTAFIAGNYDLLDQYKGYVRLFHNDFVEIYSDFCSGYMTDRVAVDVKTIETRYDSDGFVESQEQIGETYRIYIEPKFLDRFESFRAPNRAWALAKMIRIISNKTSIHATNRAVGRALDVFIGDRNMIKNFLNRNKCKGEKSQSVYENLDRYFRRMPPKKF